MPLAAAAPARRNTDSGVCEVPEAHDAAEAGEVLADGPGQNPALGHAPVKVGDAHHQPLDVAFAMGDAAVEDRGRHPELLQFADGIGKVRQALQFVAVR